MSASPADAVEQPDVVVIGAGPAGLTAGLNLVRARRSVLLVDTNRPRHAPTLHSHGTLGLDGIPPLELRRLGREQFLAYPGAAHASGRVESVGPGLAVSVSGLRGAPDLELRPRAVLLATGLTEVLPRIENLRAYYGTALHSCIECDAYEKAGQSLALIGAHPDLVVRALEIAHWAPDLIVFTCGAPVVSDDDESRLSDAGIRVEREPVAAIEGERAVMTGVRLASGRVIAREGGFVRPEWIPQASLLSGTDVSLDRWGRVLVDSSFRTTVPGLYAAGDVTAREPMQIAVAAGEGAVVARAIHLDLLDALADFRDSDLIG